MGLHNPVFKPGVAEAINGTEQELRVQASEYLGNNAHKVESILLSMVFFAYGSGTTVDKRSGSGEYEELYLERLLRRRRTTEKVDMDGRVVPMKDRDMGKFPLFSISD
jgi:hypothetical protein